MVWHTGYSIGDERIINNKKNWKARHNAESERDLTWMIQRFRN